MTRNIVLLLFLTHCLVGLGQTITDLRNIFNYNKGENLDCQILNTHDTLQGTIQYILFTGTNGSKVSAYLILPHQQLRMFPAVIFLNDGDQPKEAFLPEALSLANNAFASLLIDALPTKPGVFRINYHNYSDPARDLSAYRQAVLDVRRSIDFLEQHDRIDRNRIAFIGNGDGAMTGAIVSGIETRISVFMLMSCSGSYSHILKTSSNPSLSKARSGLTSDQITRYESIIKPVNPDNYLPYHRNSHLFFLFAQNDPYFDESAAKSLFQLTNEPKSQKFYKTTAPGLLILQEALTDQRKWLMDNL